MHKQRQIMLEKRLSRPIAYSASHMSRGGYDGARNLRELKSLIESHFSLYEHLKGVGVTTISVTFFDDLTLKSVPPHFSSLLSHYTNIAHQAFHRTVTRHIRRSDSFVYEGSNEYLLITPNVKLKDLDTITKKIFDLTKNAAILEKADQKTCAQRFLSLFNDDSCSLSKPSIFLTIRFDVHRGHENYNTLYHRVKNSTPKQHKIIKAIAYE